MDIGLLLAVFVVGGLVGWQSPFRRTHHIADGIVLVGLAVLLFAIGAQIGGDDRLLRDIECIGLSAVALCIGSVAGSVVCVYASTALSLISTVSSDPVSSTGSPSRSRPDTTTAATDGFDRETTGIIFGSLAVGFVLSSIVFPPWVLTRLEPVSVYALWLLLFGVGLAVGSDTGSLGYVRRLGWGVFLIPVAVALGSVVGGVLVGAAIGLPVSHGAAVAAGFGWYSYAGVVLFEVGGSKLGAIAFLANLFRELLTFLVVPPVVKYLNGITSVSVGGATTMDVTLPLIRTAAGDEFVVPALINGIVLAAFAVVLIPLFMQL